VNYICFSSETCQFLLAHRIKKAEESEIAENEEEVSICGPNCGFRLPVTGFLSDKAIASLYITSSG
jgi:hypothetical protein